MPPSNCCFPYFLIYIHFWMVPHFTWMCCPESSHRKIALLAGISTADELDWLTVLLAKLKPDGIFRSSPMGWFPSGHASFTLLYRCFCWYSDLGCIRVWSIPRTWRVETQPEEVELCEQNYCKMNDTNCTNKGSEAARSAGLVFRIWVGDFDHSLRETGWWTHTL